MLPHILHVIHAILSDPASTGCLELLLIPIVVYEVLAHRADRKHLAVAKQTYELYKTYFETTEKRKAEAREKAAATRAAKKAAAEPVPLPTPPDGEVPPPMSLPDDESEESHEVQ